MEKTKLTFVPSSSKVNPHVFIGNDTEDWFTVINSSDDHVPETIHRRLCAAWNACAGIPTEELESKGATAGFWGRACSRLKGKNDKLQEENARLRAALSEMERMLPVLERVGESYPNLLKEACGNTIELPSVFTYRLALETALATRSKP